MLDDLPRRIEWHEGIEIVRSHVVKISTPGGNGTGFFVARSQQGFSAIATAAHVIDDAHYWEQPIRIEHAGTKKTILLRQSDRAIFLDEAKDTAAILLDASELGFPEAPLDLITEGKYSKQGIEIGWLGFPAVSRQNLCFFSGRISYYLEDHGSYLIDGVAINGVSGGPAFRLLFNKVDVIGVVSAYIANRSTGETLPGVAVVRDVIQFQELVKQFKSIGDAIKSQAVLDEAPPPSPDAPGSLFN